MYHDFRTGGHTFSVIMAFLEDGVPTSYSPEFFAEHSEHVTLTGHYVEPGAYPLMWDVNTGWKGARTSVAISFPSKRNVTPLALAPTL